ncbi:hypothetical protein BaRGS_00003805 [Batillaria attramentaria]|uniref:HAT C-terminal dimerisation domain-containing protein n=1 Tax=Batillaria attramentaria TaxID=370345 RepID=A0ABD0M0M0_9CAEN
MASKRKAGSNDEGDGNIKKKVKREQTFIQKYTETWPFIKRGKLDTYVACEICSTEFSIKSGGSDDIKRHVASEKHKKNTAIREGEKSNNKITGFFIPKSDRALKGDADGQDVIRAETMMVDLVVELNLPMAALDRLSKGVKLMFPDSDIAKQFQCARSKGTAIVKEMAAQTTLGLAERMKKQPFTISTDGSNDKGGQKLFPLVVRTVDPHTKEVRSDALAVPAIEGSATGVNIFNLIKREFEVHEIPFRNCLALGCDNANVMVGAEKGVYGCMAKENPNVYLSGCVCHLIHIAAEKGASCLPLDVGRLLIDVYYFLERSSKRLATFKCMQVLHNLKETKILKHVSTRWLSIGNCLPRLISNWDALKDFFKSEEGAASDSSVKKKAGDLRRLFQSPTNKLYCLFLADIIKVFDAVNTKLQSDEPKVHKMRGLLHSLLKQLFLRFVKPSALNGTLLTEVSFKLKSSLKVGSELIVGDEARSFIEHATENHLRAERVQEFYDSVHSFFKASCEYMLKKLPLSDELLKHAEVVDPVKQVDARFSSLEYFLKRFPVLKHADATMTDMQLEFSTYQATDISVCIDSTDRVDATWREIEKLEEDKQPLFKYLPSVMLAILTIPHSSAHCERVFSLVRKNQTDFRGSLGQEMIESLVVAKSRPGTALDRSYNKSQLQDLKSSYYRSLKHES